MQSYAYETIHEAVHDFKVITQESKTEELQKKAAYIVREAMHRFFKEQSDVVFDMVKRYYAIFNSSPFDAAQDDPRLIEAGTIIKKLRHRIQKLERTNEALQQKINSIHDLDTTGLDHSAVLYDVSKQRKFDDEAAGYTYEYQTIQQALHALKRIINSQDSDAKQQAAFIIRESMDRFFMQNSGILTKMISHYFAVFGQSPFRVEEQQNPRVQELEGLYADACKQIQNLRLELEELEGLLQSEKNTNELLQQELAAMSVAHEGNEEDRAACIVAKLYEQLRDAFSQYEKEFGNLEETEELRDGGGSLRPIERQEAELKTMISHWDTIMRQLRSLNQKVEMYEKMEQDYEQHTVELTTITEQRDLLKLQLSDLHRKFDAEQTKNTIALNDARSQVDAVRNQLAEVKNQLALAKKQQQSQQQSQQQPQQQLQQQAPKHQENEELLQAERIAYEGALSDERLQRQKLRQQVQELQKRLENERTMYEQRILSLEKEVVMLIERLPAQQRGSWKSD